ncbi:glycosyltransferase family 39 protein [Pontibacter sp. Tf4]|uniref:glycosyltransferase family 39 protein n=1 Tax=Pontibacter sp. Tf4 TaxID=2761620 RepID=UPI001624FFDA|nr:glycosyltransferase family 39 protein [Pontibacter sp. Tf4]MBB6611561.1 glycosyltransferase family 39 protein [Pontibacter sp. Tf4]
MRLRVFRLSGKTIVWAIFLIMFLALLCNLGGWGVLETSEARYAEISRNMLVTCDWLHPRLLGILHYHKPPVTYLISAGGMALFGVNSFGVRFFLQISLLLQGLLVYLLAKELFRNREIAVTALLVYFTMPVVLISARNLTTDSYLANFELLAIWAWVKHKSTARHGWVYLFYSLLGLAFLTKGPVGLVFPVLVVISYAFHKTETGSKTNVKHLLAGFALFLVLGGSWFVYLMLQDRQFVDYFFIRHIVDRYAHAEAFSREKPWWFYIVLAPLLSLPWSVILLSNYKWLSDLQRRFKWLFMLWLVVPLLFFSFSSSKLILYILPLFAGLALLVAWLLYRLPERSLHKVSKWAMGYYIFLAVALIAGPLLQPGLQVYSWSLSLPVLMVLCLFLIWRSNYTAVPKLLLGSFIFTVLLLPFVSYLLQANPALTNSAVALRQVLQQKELHGRRIVVYDRLLPSLAFELGCNFVTIQDHNRNLDRETQFEKDTTWKQYYLKLNQPEDSIRIVQLIQQPVVLLVKNELPAERQWLVKRLHQKRRVGAWLIYF